MTGTHERSSKFLKDLGIYAIGNLGSKIITFAMVPLYTFFVKERSDFGYYDLCLTVIFLIMPFVTLQLRDGAFRFLLETHDRDQRTRIITFIYRTLLTSIVLSLVATVMLAMFTSIAYVWYCLLLLIAMSLFEVIAQVARGLGNNKDFVAAGIISSLSIGVFSIVLGYLGIHIMIKKRQELVSIFDFIPKFMKELVKMRETKQAAPKAVPAAAAPAV